MVAGVWLQCGQLHRHPHGHLRAGGYLHPRCARVRLHLKYNTSRRFKIEMYALAELFTEFQKYYIHRDLICCVKVGTAVTFVRISEARDPGEWLSSKRSVLAAADRIDYYRRAKQIEGAHQDRPGMIYSGRF